MVLKQNACDAPAMDENQANDLVLTSPISTTIAGVLLYRKINGRKPSE